MVKSNIDSNIHYNESIEIEDEDIGYSSPLYDFKLFNFEIEIGLGKQKHTYSKYGVVYFPIYLIVNDSLVSKIGIYEVRDKEFINLVDEDGDIKLKKKGLLFYVSKEYIKEEIENLESEEKGEEQSKKTEETEELEKTEEIENSETEEKGEEDDVANLKIPLDKISKVTEKSNEKLKEGIFTEKEVQVNIPKLQEETKEQSDQIKKDYQESSRDNWLVKFRKNNNYKTNYY